MSDTTIRDQLAAIIGAPRGHTNEAGGLHAATADAILAAGWRPPARVITTAAELDALPNGSVVVDDRGDAWQRPAILWMPMNNRAARLSEALLEASKFVTVVYVPTEEARDGE